MDIAKSNNELTNKNAPVLSFKYINYKGAESFRSVINPRIYFGDSVYHGKNVWLMEAFDLDKQAIREFELSDIIEFYES